MALDLYRTAPQVAAMSAALRQGSGERARRLEDALRVLRHPASQGGAPLSLDTLARRVKAARPPRPKVTWLVAGLPQAGPDADGLARRYAPAPPPAEYAVLAMDGSQIDVEPHGPAHCFLLNTGGAYMRYGSLPEAELFSQPRLFARPGELRIADPDSGLRQAPIEGELLGIKRAVLECEALADRAELIAPDVPLLLLLDGSLILWDLSGGQYPEHVRTELLDRGLLRALDRLRALAQRRPIAFGSYISSPRSTEVANILRLAWCPHEGLESRGCDGICGPGGLGRRECDEVAGGVLDRDLFGQVLAPGERSALFPSQSSVVLSHYHHHRVHSFYVNVGEEIARVEVPSWMAQDRQGMELLHGLLWDQCAKGRGYPVALQEAHEQAVVTAADRRQFWVLVERALEAQGLPVGGSEKARSKRLRAL